MGQQFRARFKIKLGIDGEERDQEYRDVIIDYNRLRETKLKPANTFQVNKISYLYDPTKIREYDNRGRPILKYYVGILNPIVEEQDKEPTIKYIDENGKEQQTTVSGYLTNQVFDRGEVKAVIAAPMKEPQKMDWMGLLIGALMGGGIGVIIGVVLTMHGYI